MPILKVVGALLTVVFVVWLSVAVFAPIGHHPAPALLDIGRAFDGNLQLPAATISASFDEARQHMLATNSAGAKLRFAGDAAGWISFAATAAITLIAGFFGRAPAAAGAPPNTEGLSAKSVRLIGFLAALAAVLTAFSNLAITKSQEYFKQADEIRNQIVSARADVIDAPTVDDARAVLDKLLLDTAR